MLRHQHDVRKGIAGPERHQLTHQYGRVQAEIFRARRIVQTFANLAGQVVAGTDPNVPHRQSANVVQSDMECSEADDVVKVP